MQSSNTSRRFGSILFARWRAAWLAIAVLSAIPTVYFTNQELLQTRLELDTRLIVQYSLWESDPAYRGSSRNWTRFAAWLLDSEQLLERARTLHPAEAASIEEEYRRDALLAYGGVIAEFLGWWGIPLALAYATCLLVERRRTPRSV
jgi:hypothetical protein